MAMTDTRNTPARSRSAFVLPLVALAVLGAMALDTTVVRVGSDADLRQQAFDPDRFGAAEFPRIRDFVLAKAPEAPVLAAALTADKDAAIAQYGTRTSVGAVLPVTVKGVVGKGKSGIFTLDVADMPEGMKLRVQTGPAINGTDLRDIPGDIAFGQFTNQIEYQDAGSGLNRAMAAETLAGLDRDTLEGKTVTVTGAFALINLKMWLVTPVSLEVAE